MNNYKVEVCDVTGDFFGNIDLKFYLNDFNFITIRINLIETEFNRHIVKRILEKIDGINDISDDIEIINISNNIIRKFNFTRETMSISINGCDTFQNIVLPINKAIIIAFSEIDKRYDDEERYITERDEVL